VVDGLVRLLDLEQIEVDIFRGVSPPVSLQRVFGGQVAAQALVAAARTVPPERSVHSLHAYFLRAGDPSIPIVYQVDQTRDGRSFTTRRVVAIQHGRVIFTMSASFQRAEAGLDHHGRMPDVPDPESLPTLADRLAGYADRLVIARLPRPFDLRWVDDPPWQRRGGGGDPGRSQRLWLRVDGTLPDDPVLHVSVLTYASDLTLLESVLVTHGVSFGLDDVHGASLDHAMWFHRSFRTDEWLLYESASPSASGGRGLATGRIWTRDGRHVVSVVQEGLLRLARR
jgi:acyl-CoA thioesterase II